jgi:hypothetical protein
MTTAARGDEFHISAAGDDAGDGTVPARAWRTIARANRQTFRPGDRLLFRGGDSFDGNLVLRVDGAATAAAPVVIASYGKGKAIIRAGEGDGIICKDTGGLMIRDLVLVGKDASINRGTGVSILNTLPGGKRLDSVRVENVDVHGFGRYGIAVGGWPADGTQSGFSDVRISRCQACGNRYGGIHVYGFHDYYAKTYANRSVAVVNCTANDNPGDPNYLEQHSGNGILLHDVDGGLIDGCTACGNGGQCRSRSGGPVGIWAWSSRKLVIQNCVSVRNRTGGKYDGGGFDFDGGVSESIMQYNYSAENDGPGLMAFDFGAAPFRLSDNVLRFNISENDARKNGYASIYVKSLGEPIERLHVYHNTVFVDRAKAAEQPRVLYVDKSKNCRFHNNLLIAKSGCTLVDIGADEKGLVIQGNHYWAVDGAFSIRHAGRTVTSLAEWRKQSRMETLEDKKVGGTGDPLLNTTIGQIITHASKRDTLPRFQPQMQSPLIGAGLDLRSSFHIDPGAHDFWGCPLPKDLASTVGAHAGARVK